MNRLYFDDIKHIATRAAIRHWQRVGLLPDSRVSHGTQEVRVFDAELLPKIIEIARLRKLGVSCSGIGRYFQILENKKNMTGHHQNATDSSVLFNSDNIGVSQCTK